MLLWYIINMKVFHCDHCQQLVFFENTVCVSCGRRWRTCPTWKTWGRSTRLVRDDGVRHWPAAEGRLYRLCDNYTQQNVCNWAIPDDDPHPLCQSCRLTRVIPDLSQPGHKEAWCKLETAKRRLVYTLLELGCPIANKFDDPEHGLAYEFLADPENGGAPPILTGHADGVITLNVAEADDVERERTAAQPARAVPHAAGAFSP